MFHTKSCTIDSSLWALAENFVYESAPELQFSVERPANDCLQFLDIQLKTASSLCLQNGKTEVKLLLPFKSCHSKNVKAGVVRNLVDNAPKKYCSHSIGSALQRLFNCFSVAGFPEDYVFRQLLYWVNRRRKCQKVLESAKRVVLPFFHHIFHSIKTAGNRYGISTALKNDFKLSRLTPFNSARAGCNEKH